MSVVAGAGLVTLFVDVVSRVLSLDRPQPVSGKVINEAIRAMVVADRCGFIRL